VRLLDIRNNSHSAIALAKLGARAGIKDDDDDFTWMEEKVKEKLCAAMKDLKEIQKQDRQKRDESLRHRLQEAETKAQESDDPQAAQKAAKSVEAIIRGE